MKKFVKATIIFGVVMVLFFGLFMMAAAKKEPAGAKEGKADKTAEAEKEPVTLKVLGWEPGGPDFWKASADAFSAKYPWITVEYEAVPFERYFEKQGAYLASRSGPDVMTNNSGFELWERADAYVRIDEWMTPEIEKELYNVSDCALVFDERKGMLGISPSFQGNLMYYNIDILKEAGLDPDNPPQTWEEFSAAAEKIKAIGKVPLAMGVTHTIAYWFFPEIVKYYFTSKDDVYAFMKGEIPWTDPRMRKTLEMMAWIADQGWFQEGAESTVMYPDAGDVFIRGDAAFIYGIASDVFNWKVWGDAMGHEKIGVMEWPVIDPNSPFAGKFSGLAGLTHGVTVWSEHKEEAWLYVAWMGSSENADLFLRLAGGQPNNKNFDKSIVDYSPSFIKIQSIIEDNMPHTGVLMSGRELDAISRGYQQIMQKEITVDEWIEMMQNAQDQSELKKPDHPVWQQ
jgi:multiple sugar transport system substrate-binding protein